MPRAQKTLPVDTGPNLCLALFTVLCVPTDIFSLTPTEVHTNSLVTLTHAHTDKQSLLLCQSFFARSMGYAQVSKTESPQCKNGI